MEFFIVIPLPPALSYIEIWNLPYDTSGLVRDTVPHLAGAVVEGVRVAHATHYALFHGYHIMVLFLKLLYILSSVFSLITIFFTTVQLKTKHLKLN